MRYVLIVYRPSGGYSCARGCCPSVHSDSLFEKIDTKDRGYVIDALATSLFAASQHETAREYEMREHHLFVDGFACDPSHDNWWDYCDDDEGDANVEALHSEGKAIFNEANAQIAERIERTKLDAERKAADEAERQKKLVHDREVNYLARLTQERDDLAKKLGVTP